FVHDEASDRGVVVNRLRVRHAAHGGEAPAGRGSGACLDSLGRFLAWLAQVNMQVNEARRDDKAGGVEYFGMAVHSEFSRGADLLDSVSVEQNIERRVGF